VTGSEAGIEDEDCSLFLSYLNFIPRQSSGFRRESPLQNLVETPSGLWLQTTSQTANMIFSCFENLEITPLNLLLCISIFYLFYVAVLVFYRLYLSPLSKFPGPKIAAATLWTEFYYDAILGGQFQFKVKEWHAIYGT
jgi:hypothetical protein